jgi:tRNA 2-thiouridine synthesizing protein A
MKADETLDCYGLLCPMPIAETAKKVRSMKKGAVLEVIATDEAIKEDMPSWCRQTGQEFLGIEEEDDTFRVYVKKIQD